MNLNTPYSPPKSTVADVVRDYGAVKIFSIHGRIGRLRFMAWFTGFWMLTGFVLNSASMLAAGIRGQSGLGFGVLLVFSGVIASSVIVLLLVRRRLHDLDKTAWLSLLMFVPLLNLLFTLYILLAPGSRRANQYGNPPPPNTVGVVVLAWLMPVLVIGIIAAIAIPAYQGYVQRAKQVSIPIQPGMQYGFLNRTSVNPPHTPVGRMKAMPARRVALA